MKKANFVAGLLAILASIVFLIPALKMNFFDAAGRPAAGFMPVIFCVIMFLLGAWLSIRSLREKDDAPFVIQNKKMFFRAMAIIVAMPFILMYCGFLPAGLLCVFLMCWNLGITPLKSAVASVLIVFAVFFLFSYGLHVHLPEGKLF